VVANLDAQDDSLTIYATRPFTSDSHVVLAKEGEGTDVPPEAEAIGAQYFMDVFTAKEFFEGWVQRGGGMASTRERCVLLIRHALTDAWMQRRTSMTPRHSATQYV
jgi:hypothetical protein